MTRSDLPRAGTASSWTACVAASRRTQILAATHSPTLVNRLRPEEIIVCDRDLKTGESVIPVTTPEQIRASVAASDVRPGERWFSGALQDTHAWRPKASSLQTGRAWYPERWAPYSTGVTAAYDYEDLHHLVDRLTPDQARRLRLLVTQDKELSQVASALFASGATDDDAPWAGFLALFGSIDDGPTDLAERHDDYIRDRMRQRFGDLA